jgi:two-component system, NtrC family, nitrogen regulation response regulator NtrX
MKRHILVVDDELDIRTTLAGIFEDEGYEVSLAAEGRQALRSVDDRLPDLVYLDIWMPGMDGMEVLAKIKEKYPEMPVIMISGHGNIETAVKATKLGAFDFIEKPLSMDQILLITRRVMDIQRLEYENRMLREKIETKYEIIGGNASIESLQEQVRLAAPTDSRVLITGENGTGKELVARQIHLQSHRRDKPFIEVNSAAIPEELIESELFGHEKGSFTGAITKRRGKFDLADGGTIFLDEIADMSLRTQAKILRILQEQKFERVGGVESISVDVRVIAATNKDLETLIKEGKFREDLYFRLNVIPLHIPPLRERRSDIPLLVEYFVRQYCLTSGLHFKKFDARAVDLLTAYPWPGNVRELRNIVERLVIMTPTDSVSEEDVARSLKFGALTEDGGISDFIREPSWREAKTRFEKAFLIRKLLENGGNISRTAESIGVERTHLHRRIKALGIDPDNLGA